MPLFSELLRFLPFNKCQQNREGIRKNILMEEKGACERKPLNWIFQLKMHRNDKKMKEEKVKW